VLQIVGAGGPLCGMPPACDFKLPLT